MEKIKLEFKGNWIDNRFQCPAQCTGEWLTRSPADFSDEFGLVQYHYSSVEESVTVARRAFKLWRNTPYVERANALKRYQLALTHRKEDLAQMIAREVGKPLWEALAEVASMISKIDITLDAGIQCVQEYEVPDIMPHTRGVCRFQPLGVAAVLGPFNFPGHLPNGHIVPALLTGNTVIFKPSEKTPWVGQLMAECFLEAQFPAGVFNLIQGEKEIGRRLAVHEGVDAVLFTGSYEVGTRIKQDTLHQHWKLLALEMGGKNAAIILEDASLDVAVFETLTGAFLTAGQRCSATSRILVHESRFNEFVERFHQRAKAFRIGHPMDQPFMGPLIEEGAVDRYMKFLGIASREGFEVIMRGKMLEMPIRGNYVTPSICLQQSPSIEQTRKSTYQQTELFSPNVAILKVHDLEEAIEQANCSQYGLAASLFTKSQDAFSMCLDQLQVGVLNWNKATVGAASRLPFGGRRKSGNHFPTGVLAASYCTVPVASLEVSSPDERIMHQVKQISGLNWNDA